MTEKLFATFTAATGSEAEVQRLVAEYGETVRQEAGCLVFSASRLRDAPRSFFVYEEYRDEEAFRTHLAAEYGAVFNAALVPLIEEEQSILTLLDTV